MRFRGLSGKKEIIRYHRSPGGGSREEGPTYKEEGDSEGERPVWGPYSLIYLLRSHWVPGPELCSSGLSKVPAPVREAVLWAGRGTARWALEGRARRAGIDTPPTKWFSASITSILQKNPGCRHQHPHVTGEEAETPSEFT